MKAVYERHIVLVSIGGCLLASTGYWAVRMHFGLGCEETGLKGFLLYFLPGCV